MISLLHQEHKKFHPRLSKEIWAVIEDEYHIAQKERDKFARFEDRRLEGLGKAPAFYAVLFYILDLVPVSYPNREFYISLFLFMLSTGQRYVTICNIKLCDILAVVRKQNLFSIKIVCRITKANQDWNQPFILEGDINDNRIMNFVYWLNLFLINAHGVRLVDFDTWEKNASKYLWGSKRKNNNYEKKIPYITIYEKWRFFYKKAGIPDRLLGTHSFRSGFYCQSLLNASKKGVDYNVMNELSMLLAGWQTKRDRAIYLKNNMRALITPSGAVDNPSPEQLLCCDNEFVSEWKPDNIDTSYTDEDE